MPDRTSPFPGQVCPLEHDNTTLLVVLGGETAQSGENKHSTSVEVRADCEHTTIQSTTDSWTLGPVPSS